jgi:DNA-binding response OmpR family regulator
LSAESDQQLRVWMRHIPEAKGSHIGDASDRYQALARIERGQLVLVMLDFDLPNVNGVESSSTCGCISHL